MQRAQILRKTGAAVNTDEVVTTGVVSGESMERVGVYMAPTTQNATYKLYMVMTVTTLNDTSVEIASVTVTAGQTSTALSMGPGCPVNIPIPPKWKIEGTPVSGGKAAIVVWTELGNQA